METRAACLPSPLARVQEDDRPHNAEITLEENVFSLQSPFYSGRRTALLSGPSLPQKLLVQSPWLTQPFWKAPAHALCLFRLWPPPKSSLSMPPGLQPVPSPLHSDVTHERMLRHHRAHGRDARDRCTGAVSPSALQPRDPGWRGGRLLPPGLSEPFITPWAEIIELFSSVSVLLLDAPAVLAARTEACQSFGRGCVFTLITRTSMDQIPPRHLNKTGVQMKKNLCVFAGFYVVQEIVSSCSDVIEKQAAYLWGVSTSSCRRDDILSEAKDGALFCPL